MTADSRGRNGQRAGDLRRLADLFELAGSYFLAGPTEQVDTLLGDSDWVEGLVAMGLLPEGLGGEDVSAEEHAREYEVLLRIPDRDRSVPPQESAHVPRPEDPLEAPALVCRRLYERAGYDGAPFANVAPDHVGHQLRFLAALMRREAECLDREDAAAALNVRTWVEGFASEHAGWWAVLGQKVGTMARARPLRIMAGLVGRLGSVPTPEGGG